MQIGPDPAEQAVGSFQTADSGWAVRSLKGSCLESGGEDEKDAMFTYDLRGVGLVAFLGASHLGFTPGGCGGGGRGRRR